LSQAIARGKSYPFTTRLGAYASDALSEDPPRDLGGSAVLPTKTLSLATTSQLLNGRNLNLADAFTGHPDEPSNLHQSQRFVAADAITQLDHATFAVTQLAKHYIDVFRKQSFGDDFFWRLFGVVLDHVADRSGTSDTEATFRLKYQPRNFDLGQGVIASRGQIG
jgi:hypothetical protein